MLNCPKCKFEIDCLDHDVTATCGGSFYSYEAKQGKKPCETYDLDSLMVNVEIDNWRCPECQEILFKQEDEAIEFLKGDTEE